MARCHTEDGQIIRRLGAHNHVPDTAKVEARRTLEKIKTHAVGTLETTHQLVANASANVNEAVAGQLPPVRNIKNTIKRIRYQAQAPLPTPKNLLDLAIDGEFLIPLRGENFLLHDIGPGKHRTIMFSTQRNLDLMAQCPNWYCDGTFKVAPPLFQQLYTIHAVQYHNVIPTVFVLMSERSTNADGISVVSVALRLIPDMIAVAWSLAASLP